MNSALLPKRISIDIIFCGLQKQFTTKATKGSQKLEMIILSYVPSPFSREQKLSFYFIKTFVILLWYHIMIR